MQHIPENEWSITVRSYAGIKGWKVWWTPISIRTNPGEPDLRMLRPPRYILAELKKEKGIGTAEQLLVGEMLMECPGLEYYLWRPSDWDTVMRILE